jgi:hypothetical protein
MQGGPGIPILWPMSTRCACRVGLLAAVLFAVGAAGCGSDDSSGTATGTGRTEPAATPNASTSEPAPSSGSPIEGLWEQEHSCQQLVDALADSGLASVAAGVVGDYFPDQTPQELAAKDDPCAGAVPQRHAHFFTADGQFGSVDADDQQVDDGPYRVQGDVLTIGDEGESAGRFRYTVTGDTLTLEPLVRDRDRQKALANPLDFNLAGWQVAVSYGGLPFTRVPCDGWC